MIEPLTHEETKKAIDALKPTQPTQPTQASKPVETKPAVAKEVKPVIEVKDPTGQFDYTGCEKYTVKDGDSLFDVAEKYHIAMQQLRYFNHIDKLTMRIRPGQVLYIPTKPVYVPTGK